MGEERKRRKGREDQTPPEQKFWLRPCATMSRDKMFHNRVPAAVKEMRRDNRNKRIT